MAELFKASMAFSGELISIRTCIELYDRKRITPLEYDLAPKLDSSGGIVLTMMARYYPTPILIQGDLTEECKLGKKDSTYG